MLSGLQCHADVIGAKTEAEDLRLTSESEQNGNRREIYNFKTILMYPPTCKVSPWKPGEGSYSSRPQNPHES